MRRRSHGIKKRLVFYLAAGFPLGALFEWWYVSNVLPARIPAWRKDLIDDIGVASVILAVEIAYEIVRARRNRRLPTPR